MQKAPLAILLLLAACGNEPDLRVYCSLDQVHSEKIIQLFEERTGLEVEARYDVERNKTVGLVNAIIAEADNPRADVYWNNEIAHTIRLKERGLTQAYRSPSAESIPPAFRDPEGHWTGFAARARVFLINSERWPSGLPYPSCLRDLLDDRYRGMGGMARPLTGTTLTHAAALCTVWGEQNALAFFELAKRNAESGRLFLTPGNGDAMRRVVEGDFLFCLTDTDDASVALDGGFQGTVVYPGQKLADDGVLLIPNTVALLARAPHPDAARKFVDFVLSPEVEAILAAGRSAQIPLRPGLVSTPDSMAMPEIDFTPLIVDWPAVAKQIETQAEPLNRMFRD